MPEELPPITASLSEKAEAELTDMSETTIGSRSREAMSSLPHLIVFVREENIFEIRSRVATDQFAKATDDWAEAVFNSGSTASPATKELL